MEPGIADRQEGDRHGEPFRQVLQADTDGERGAVAEIAAAEADPDGEPLRDVVERNGNDEQPEPPRSEEHTSELQSLMRISYAVFCLKKKKQHTSMRLTERTQYSKRRTISDD